MWVGVERGSQQTKSHGNFAGGQDGQTGGATDWLTPALGTACAQRMVPAASPNRAAIVLDGMVFGACVGPRRGGALRR